MRNNGNGRNGGSNPNPFREQFRNNGIRPSQNPEQSRFWELVAAARGLARLYVAATKGLKRDSEEFFVKIEELKGSAEYKAGQDRLSQAKKAFPSAEEQKNAVRSIQRMVVRGDLDEGVLFYVNSEFVPTTRTFKWAFRALPEDVREKYKITDSVNPPNGIAILKALDEFSGDPGFLQIFMGFKKLMTNLGWINWEPKPREDQAELADTADQFTEDKSADMPPAAKIPANTDPANLEEHKETNSIRVTKEMEVMEAAKKEVFNVFKTGQVNAD